MTDETQEVYCYVREKSIKYLPVIIRAITDGVNAENERMREQKSKVEGGLVVLSFLAKKFKKLDRGFRETLIEAYNNCTFFMFDECKKKLQESEHDREV